MENFKKCMFIIVTVSIVNDDDNNMRGASSVLRESPAGLERSPSVALIVVCPHTACSDRLITCDAHCDTLMSRLSHYDE